MAQKVAHATLSEGGAAYDLNRDGFLLPHDLWSFPKYPGRTRILPSDVDLPAALTDFIIHNEPFLREPDCWLGTWIHPESHEFYLDIATGCTDVEDAIKIARQVSERDGRKIVALYNSKRKDIVYL